MSLQLLIVISRMGFIDILDSWCWSCSLSEMDQIQIWTDGWDLQNLRLLIKRIHLYSRKKEFHLKSSVDLELKWPFHACKHYVNLTINLHMPITNTLIQDCLYLCSVCSIWFNHFSKICLFFYPVLIFSSLLFARPSVGRSLQIHFQCNDTTETLMLIEIWRKKLQSIKMAQNTSG